MTFIKHATFFSLDGWCISNDLVNINFNTLVRVLR